MNIEGVIIFDAKSGIPLFSKLRENIDPSLFSSFITAIGHFSQELKFGGLSSFSTEEKVIHLAARETTITALISPKSPEYQQAYSLANELGRQFEDLHRQSDGEYEPDEFSDFHEMAAEFLQKIRNPFYSRVAGFVHEKYGGSVSIKPRLMKRTGAEGIVDMVVNLPQKEGQPDNGGKKDRKGLSSAFSKNFIFVKVADGRLGRGEFLDFIDSIDGYGVRIISKGKINFMPYYPSRVVIVAREFDSNVFEYLKKLPKSNNQTYIDGAHVFAEIKMKDVPKNTKCIIELYEWREGTEPELVFG